MNFKHVLLHLFHPRKSNNHRPKLLHPESYVFFIAIALAFFVGLNSLRHWPSFFQGVLGFSSSITASQVIEMTNQERVKAGLSELTASDKLNEAAVAKAQHIFAHQYWAHVAPDGTEPWQFIIESGYSYRAAGENLARDFSNTENMVAAWMASPTHRANILEDKYTEIGIAVVDGELLGYETTLVVQFFGSPIYQTANISSQGTTKGTVNEAEPEIKLEPEMVKLAAVPQVSEQNNENIVITIPKFESPPLYTPLQLTKAIFLTIILLIILTLVYDIMAVHNTNTVRLVGKNIAHIMFLSAVAYIIIFFKGGIIS